MDVICAGMYRACSTWQYEVVGDLVERHRGGRRLGYVEGGDYDPRPGRSLWRVLKCHDRHPRFARAIETGQAVAVYAVRDLRDVVDSMAHQSGRSFEELMGEGLVHRILDNDRFWTAQRAVLVQRYEDLTADPVSGVRALAEFLGIELAHSEAERTAETYSPAANRQRAEALRRQLAAEGLDPDAPEQRRRHDPASLLHGHHLRDGRPGRWREAFSPAQAGVLARLTGSWLTARGYEPDGSWAPDLAPASLVPLLVRSRVHAWIYFAARRHPRPASSLRRLLGLGSLPGRPGDPAPEGPPAGQRDAPARPSEIKTF